MKTILILLFAFTFSVTIFGQDTLTDIRTGVKIIFIAEGKIFPPSWYSKKINAQGVSLDTCEYLRSKKVIMATLQKYPTELLQKNLSTVYILKHIAFFDQPYGGTNSNTSIYLSNDGIKNGYTDFYLEQLFHAEFSSILLRNNKKALNKRTWIKNNSDGFEYGNGGVDALKENKDSELFDSTLNKSGFINEYALSSFENDFNSFAKNIFLPKSGFDLLIERHKKLNNKRKLIIKFYSRLDKSFTEDFFNQFLYATKPTD